jgi:integrase
MKQVQMRKTKGRIAKSVLRLPDLEVAKSAVLNSLSCPDAQRGYRHAIDEFVDWYCSEPRLSFSKTVVVRYRMHLDSRYLTPGTISLRLGAVRCLAYGASDCRLLSADLAAGIRRVKCVRKLGVRLGNRLTAEQGITLRQAPDPERLKGKRDRALLSVLLACGLRRHEVAELTVDHLQQGALGDCQPERQRRLRTDSAGSRLGPSRARHADGSCGNQEWESVPPRKQRWQIVGRRSHREACPARCEGIRGKDA